ncbi:MAG: hemerythrin family protein [Verrucomicrobiales bacterium]|nr:hemerythrin family protein [Verrucomicrobiales bacterium]
MSEYAILGWTDSLKTGNRAIDNQHKYLIDLINELASCLEAGKAAQELKKIVNLLYHFTEWHFCLEEKCMESKNCPLAAENKDAHGQFIKAVTTYQEKIRASSQEEFQVIGTEMHKVLISWFVNHIQKIDIPNLSESGDV